MSKARAIADAFEADGDLKLAAADELTPRIGGAFVGTNGESNGQTGSEDIFRIHTRVVDAETTIPAGNNAICAGPIELTANLIVEGTLTIV
jgi:hypothetical protein